MISLPVARMSAGTDAAIGATAPGPNDGSGGTVLLATPAWRVSLRSGPPRTTRTPKVPSAATATSADAVSNTRRDDHRRGAEGTRRAECRPDRPVVRTGVCSARRVAAARSAAFWYRCPGFL